LIKRTFSKNWGRPLSQRWSELGQSCSCACELQDYCFNFRWTCELTLLCHCTFFFYSAPDTRFLSQKRHVFSMSESSQVANRESSSFKNIPHGYVLTICFPPGRSPMVQHVNGEVIF